MAAVRIRTIYLSLMIFFCLLFCFCSENVKVKQVNLAKIQSIPQRDDESVFLTFPTSFAISDSGTIYIADQQAQSVFKFLSNGEFQQNMGAIGGGPGEFESPSRLFWDNNTLTVWDVGNSRMEIFDAQDNYLHSIRISSAIQQFVRTENSIITQRLKRGDEDNAASDEALLIEMDSTGTVTKSFGQSVRAFVDIPQFPAIANARVNNAFLKVYNNKIYLAHKNYAIVQVYSLDGEFEKAYSFLDDPYFDFTADNYNAGKVMVAENITKFINLYKGFDVNKAGMFFCVNQYQDLNMDIHQFDFDGKRKNIYHYTLPQLAEDEGYWLIDFQCRVQLSPQDLRFYVLMPMPYPELQVFSVAD